MKKIVLASGSPRRKELLERIGLKFEVDSGDYVENIESGLSPYEIARKLSLEKAKSIAGKYPDTIIIGADTFGVLNGKIIGKPHHEVQAKKILHMLSGKSHLVITGFTIIDTGTGKTVTKLVETTVHFRELSDAEIDAYVATGEPLDKAGAYGIQGLGATLVERIEGDFDNVVGLPLAELVKALREFGVVAESKTDKIKEIGDKIADLKARWPAHSVPPSMWQELEKLEDELERARGKQEQ